MLYNSSSSVNNAIFYVVGKCHELEPIFRPDRMTSLSHIAIGSFFVYFCFVLTSLGVSFLIIVTISAYP